MRLDPRQRLVAEKAKPRRIDVAVNGAPTSLETGEHHVVDTTAS